MPFEKTKLEILTDAVVASVPRFGGNSLHVKHVTASDGSERQVEWFTIEAVKNGRKSWISVSRKELGPLAQALSLALSGKRQEQSDEPFDAVDEESPF